MITQLVFLITRDRTQIIYHAAKYSRCSVYAASAWKTKIRDAYDEWWRCRRPADPLPLNILTLFVWIPLFGLVRSHHVVVSSLLLLMEKILSKILPLGYSRKFFVSDQFFRFSSIFRSIFSSIRFFFSLIRFLINSKSNKCKLSAVLQKIILGWIQRKKNEFFGNRFWIFLFLVSSGKWPFWSKMTIFLRKLTIFWQFSWLGWVPKNDISTFSRKFQVSGNSPNFIYCLVELLQIKGTHRLSLFCWQH